jgi:hypothetical protein
MPPPDKLCATCGRRFAWRRKWADDWDAVRYCSTGCRRHRPGALDRRLERAILDLLAERDGSICPSEAARRVDPTGWRDLLERTRRAGRRLAAEGRLVVTQRGRPVDPSDARGPIRYGRPR